MSLVVGSCPPFSLPKVTTVHWHKESKVLGFPWPFEVIRCRVMSLCNHWDLEAPPVWQGPNEPGSSDVPCAFDPPLEWAWDAVVALWTTQTSWGLLYSTSCLKQLLRSTSDSAPDHFCSLVEGSGVCPTGCMWVTSHFVCSKQNSFLVGPFSGRLAHVPVGLHDGSSPSAHPPVWERGWCLGSAEPSPPFLLPWWTLGRCGRADVPEATSVLCEPLVSSWQTLHLWVGAWVMYACSSYCLIKQFN